MHMIHSVKMSLCTSDVCIPVLRSETEPLVLQFIYMFHRRHTLRDRRDDEQRGSPYDAKCNVAEIDAVNMGEIGAVRKRSR